MCRFPRGRSGALLVALALVTTTTSALVGSAPAVADTTVTITGGGWGHGVGMSQYGALGMANAGLGAADILGHYYQSTAVQPLTQPNGIRVLVSTVASSTLTGAGAVGYYDYNSGTQVKLAAPGEVVGIAAENAQIRIGGPGGVLASSPVVIDYAGNPLLVGSTGKRYSRGVLVAKIASPGLLQLVVEQLTMQQYLYGLAEVPSSWPVEALRAQAIAGRTYAKEAVDRRRADPSRPYDLDGSVQDQAYAGYEKEVGAQGLRWVQAVDNSDGLTITYGGRAIQAFYSSSSGGYTENSEYVFSTALPYLRGVPDPYDNAPGNSNYRWTRTFSGSELGAWVAADTGASVGTVSGLVVLGGLGVSGRVDRATIRVIGSGGTRDMTGNGLRAIIARHSPSRQLLSTRLFFSPEGAVDAIARTTAAPGGVSVRGWALDPETSAPIAVHAYVDGGWGGSYAADQSRPDVGATFPGLGDAHGFDFVLSLRPGEHTVCVWAINAGAGSNRLIDCRRTVVDGTPFGSLDALTRSPGGARAQGWALDPDGSNPIHVHAYVDGHWGGDYHADQFRPDVGQVFAGYGDQHGYSVPLAMGPGLHQVCMYAINGGPGANALLGCRAISISSNPIGSVDGGSRTGVYQVHVFGWTIDPDTAAPISVHAYIDAAWGGSFASGGTRTDVGAVYPDYGAQHGYDLTLAVPAGPHFVCLYGINDGAGTNPALGCVVPGGARPIGSLDEVRREGDTVVVRGWTIDPDTLGVVQIHVYVDDGWAGAYTAAAPRPDVAAAYPGYGERHGYQQTIGVTAGPHRVCAYGINDAGPDNVLLGCAMA